MRENDTQIEQAQKVREQYQNADNLNTRISIHAKYSVNRQSFGEWIVENYEIPDGARILELGCGNGSVWEGRQELFAKCEEIFLTDISEGMLTAAREKLGPLDKVHYKVVDIQDIPFADDSFDVVIANMMLYHVPDLQKGLAQVRRVLKPEGRFYCATFSEINVMPYVADKLRPYGVDYRVEDSFTLENGEEKLRPHFRKVQALRREDALDITNPEDLMDYLYSGIGFPKECSLSRNDIRAILEKEMVDGVLHIPKIYGMFVAGN